MNKNILYSIIFFVCVNSFSQIKDTVMLEEVKILATNKKVEHLKTKGRLSSLTGNPIKAIVSKVDEIPDGKLSSIKFFFNRNPIFFIKDVDRANYKAVAVGLLIYDLKNLR